MDLGLPISMERTKLLQETPPTLQPQNVNKKKIKEDTQQVVSEFLHLGDLFSKTSQARGMKGNKIDTDPANLTEEAPTESQAFTESKSSMQVALDPRLSTSASLGTRMPYESSDGNMGQVGEVPNCGKTWHYKNGLRRYADNNSRANVTQQERYNPNSKSPRVMPRFATTTCTHGTTSIASLGAIPAGHRLFSGVTLYSILTS